MRGAGRRRSTSEGEGDRLSSTLNLPEAHDLTNLIILIPIDVRLHLRLMLLGLLMTTLRVAGGRGLNPGSILGRGQLQMLLIQN